MRSPSKPSRGASQLHSGTEKYSTQCYSRTVRAIQAGKMALSSPRSVLEDMGSLVYKVFLLPEQCSPAKLFSCTSRNAQDEFRISILSFACIERDNQTVADRLRTTRRMHRVARA